MSRFERMRRRLDPRRIRPREEAINASAPPQAPPREETDTVRTEPQPERAEAPPATSEPPAKATGGEWFPKTAAGDRPPTPETASKRPVPVAADAVARAAPKRRRRLSRVPAPMRAVGAALALGALVAGLYGLDVLDSPEGEPAAKAPAPVSSAGTRPEPANPTGGGAEEAAAEIGFPAFATKNTTRVGGSDPAANAAGVALATFPSAGGVERPVAVTLVGDEDWQAGIAGAVLMAEPVRAPILLSTPDSVPDVTSDSLSALSPRGSIENRRVQVYALGDVAAPDGFEVRRLGGRDPAATAAAIERLHDELVAGPPDHIVVTSSEQAGFAMPAAAWAARSGDPVLFASRENLPRATAKALGRHKKVPVYVLGPSSAISSDVLREIDKAGGPVRRVGGEDPVSNSVDFARYADGTFGWNINDPGHGFVVARSDRPLDAVAAAPLSASGTWGPLLLTDSAGTLPGALRGYLLDVKPGYRTDPTRALYNRVWVIGDQETIDVNQQAAIDDLAELARIQSAEPKQEKRPAGTAGGGGEEKP